jgi:hypothetical protein
MATPSRSRKSGDEAPAPKEVRAQKAPPKGAVSNGPTAPTEAQPGRKASRTPRFNATTIKAMQDAKAGKNLTRYIDEDDLFQKLGIKLGKAQTKAKA